MKIIEQSHSTLPKNLIRPLPMQDHKSKRFQRSALPFACTRWLGMGQTTKAAHQREKTKTLTQIRLIFGEPMTLCREWRAHDLAS